MSLFRILIAGDAAVKDSIAKALGSVMVKVVELQYSGTGRVIHGQGKKNFSETNTYLCLRSRISFNINLMSYMTRIFIM